MDTYIPLSFFISKLRKTTSIPISYFQ